MNFGRIFNDRDQSGNIDRLRPVRRPAGFRRTLGAAEYTAFQKVLRESKLGAVLNEKDITPVD